MVLQLCLTFALFISNAWSAEVRSDNGFRYSVTQSDGRRTVTALDSASSPEQRLRQLEDQIFLKHGGTRTMCADQRGVPRATTVARCVRAMERILADDTRDWSLMSGIFLNATDEISAHLRDAFDPRRDIFGFVWLTYDFSVSSLNDVFAELGIRHQVQIDDDALLSALLGRKVAFRCHEQINNCRLILNRLTGLRSESLAFLRENSWIWAVHVWPELHQIPRMAPSGTFSRYQLNLSAKEDLANLERAIQSPNMY